MHTLNDLIGRQERVIFVEKDASVREAAKAMAEGNVGCTAIMEGPHLVGIFTERDVLKRVLLQDMNVDEVKVADVMTTEIIATGPAQSVIDAHHLMKRHHIRHLPVLDDDAKLLGVISIRDLLIDHIEDLRRYLALAEG